ncbi:UNVERIFIED_CONTAM: hypothetical protein N8J90_01235 [Halobacillus marinus]
MKPDAAILRVWRMFDDFPMETISKVWVYQQSGAGRQRSVGEMRTDRERYGLSGNCFDLSLWLLEEFRKSGVTAYPVGDRLGTTEAHAAVVALGEGGERYLCDLGDQWISPVLIDVGQESFTGERLGGFFPAAEVQVCRPANQKLEIHYHRPNGKMSSQIYDLTPVDLADFLKAAEHSQNTIHPVPLIERRISFLRETAHWEFDEWKIVLSTSAGLYDRRQDDASLEDLAKVIADVTGMKEKVLFSVLLKYWEWKS